MVVEEEILPGSIAETIMKAPFIDDWREKRAGRVIFSLIDKKKYRVNIFSIIKRAFI